MPPTENHDMEFPAEGSKAIRFMLFIALVLFLVIAVKMVAYIVTILVVSVVLTMLALPVMQYFQRRGAGHVLSVVIVTIIAFLLILLLVGLTALGFGVLVRDLPMYQAELTQKLSVFAAQLTGYGFNAESVLSSVNLQSILVTVLSWMGSLGDTLLYLFFIGITTFFMLLEAPRISERAKALFPARSVQLDRVSKMSRYMIDFMVVRTETNLVHGVLFGGALAIMGVHAALLWGVLTFVLSYIPYIGLIIAAIPAIFFAWLQFGVWGVVAVVALVCILNLVVENPVFSYFASRTFEMPALIVILSVIFWGWLLGMAGLLFSVPISLMVLIFIQSSDELSWVNAVLGVDHLFQDEESAKEEVHPG